MFFGDITDIYAWNSRGALNSLILVSRSINPIPDCIAHPQRIAHNGKVRTSRFPNVTRSARSKHTHVPFENCLIPVAWECGNIETHL